MDWSVTDVATLVAGALAAVGLARAAQSAFRRTIGRRQDRYRRLYRLGTGARLSFFESVLGEPPAMQRSHVAEVEEWADELREFIPVSKRFTEVFFIQPDHYVQALCDDEDTVVAFSVTARSRRFRPTFVGPMRMGLMERLRVRRRLGEAWEPLFRVKLCQTRFADTGVDSEIVPATGHLGARNWSYSEQHGFGNPGLYQTYVFTASSAAAEASTDFEAFAAWEQRPQEGQFDDGSFALSAHGRRFREGTTVTTFTVIGPHLDPEQLPMFFGPHGDEVRTLP